jgi:hypothetical protein
MATTYNKTSCYANTDSYGFFLDVANLPKIPQDPKDVQYQIDAIYKGRPDLLAYDLYSDSSLWWVFALRNPNVLQDPIYDFQPGVIIFVPQKTNLTTALGL